MILECSVICECDGCGDEDSFEIGETDHTGFTQSRVIDALKSSGWILDLTRRGGPKMLCDKCVGTPDYEQDPDDARADYQAYKDSH